MALREKTIVEQRLSAMELLALGMSVRDVAERMGVSRQAVYDWQKRHAEQGAEGLNPDCGKEENAPLPTAAFPSFPQSRRHQPLSNMSLELLSGMSPVKPRPRTYVGSAMNRYPTHGSVTM